MRSPGRTAPLPVLLAALALAGCQSVPGKGKSPNTTLGMASYGARNLLVVSPVPFTGAAQYRPVPRCTYRQDRVVANGPSAETRMSLSSRSVRDRLLLTMTEGAQTSTILISPDGTLHDFNVIAEGGRRVTTENIGQEAQRQLATMGQPYAVAFNQITAVFPHYDRTAWSVGAPVATVRTQDGKDWAQYVYRGVTPYAGTQAAVLDLMSITSEGGQPTLIGYNLVDMTTMMPLLYVFETQNRLRLERLSCP